MKLFNICNKNYFQNNIKIIAIIFTIFIIVLTMSWTIIIKITNKELNNTNSKGEKSMNINIIVGDKTFRATLENNEAAKKLIDILPLEIDMIIKWK